MTVGSHVVRIIPSGDGSERARVSELLDTGLLDSPPEEDFDRLTRLSRRLLDVPVSLVSLVDDHRQFFKSSQGLPEPWASERETPLSHSFCQHVVAASAPLIVSDARRHPLVCDNLAIRDLDVVGYLGIPLRTPDGHTIGSLCAIDSEPREWTDTDVELLQEMAALVMKEIALRHHVAQLRRAEAALQAQTGELEQLNRELEQFTQVAAHDLRAPLSAILLLSRLLQRQHRESLGTGGLDVLGKVITSATRMQELMQELLTFSRSGHRALALQRVSLSTLVADVVAEQSVALDSCGALVEWGALPTVDADPTFLRLVVQNLVDNAVKYCRDDRPRVHIGAERDGDRWVVEVRDNGIGVPEAEREAIFEPFRRAHAEAGFEGSGIGLATCKRVVERHGGRIWVEDAPGGGSRFRFTLPAAPEAA